MIIVIMYCRNVTLAYAVWVAEECRDVRDGGTFSLL